MSKFLTPNNINNYKMNKVLSGFFIILLFLLIGTALHHLLIPILPSSVIGMILLFIALQLKIVKEEPLDKVVSFMMSSMPIFFLPPAVGIMVALPLVSEHLMVISMATIISTIAIIVSVGWCQQGLNRRKR